jgi:hypothetical protein
MTASRLDGICVTDNLFARKQGVETVAIDVPLPARERGYWKKNTLYLSEKAFREELQEQ